MLPTVRTGMNFFSNQIGRTVQMTVFGNGQPRMSMGIK